MKQQIAVELKGGLGNQLFQYAAGRALAHQHGCRLVLDLSWFDQLDPIATTPRAFALAPFRLPATLRSSGFWGAGSTGRGNNALPAWLQRVAHKVAALAAAAGRGLNGTTVYRERDFSFDAGVHAVQPPAELYGYWQSARYFEPVANLLREELGRPRALGAASQRLLADIQACSAICLHVRRGDYISNQHAAKLFGPCSPAYYEEALRLVARGLIEPTVFVFSDDPDWVRDNLVFDTPSVIVDVNGPDAAHEDLWLMAACQHFVIANSSLSWWGAWLGGHIDKRVVAPDRWFATGNKDTRDLLPASWTRL